MTPINLQLGTNPESNDPNANNQAGTTVFGQGPGNISALSPANLQYLSSLGYNGPTIDSTAGTGGSQDVGPTPSSNTFDPAFLSFLQKNDVTPLATAGSGNSEDLNFFGGQGQQVAPTQNQNLGSDAGWMAIASALLGGAAGVAAGGAGAAAGAAEGSGGSAGLSSSDLAALYGDSGYTGTLAPDTLEAGATPIGAMSGATGATNPSLIDSALQTPGYGLSSAGLGGGAGDLTGIAGPTAGGSLGSMLGNAASTIGKALTPKAGAGGNLLALLTGGNKGPQGSALFQQQMLSNALRNSNEAGVGSTAALPGWSPK